MASKLEKGQAKTAKSVRAYALGFSKMNLGSKFLKVFNFWQLPTIHPMENKPLPNPGAKPSNETTQGLSQESEWKVVLNKIQAWLGTTKKISDQLDEFFNTSILILVLGVIAICLKAYITILNEINIKNTFSYKRYWN